MDQVVRLGKGLSEIRFWCSFVVVVGCAKLIAVIRQRTYYPLNFLSDARIVALDYATPNHAL